MAIILEGPDASGKTTLARHLRDEAGMELIVAGGAPENRTTLRAYCEKQAAALDNRRAVMDRFSPISHPIYNPEYQGDPELQHYLEMAMSHPDTLIIYCRPPTDVLMMPEKHEWKDWDTEAHKQKVLQNQMTFIERYDLLFHSVPCLTYDYTDPAVRETIFKMIVQASNDDHTLTVLRTYAKKVQLS